MAPKPWSKPAGSEERSVCGPSAMLLAETGGTGG
jgi:hypothetical protein